MPGVANRSRARWARARRAGALAALFALAPAAVSGEELVTLTGAPVVRLWSTPAALEAATRAGSERPGIEQPVCAVARGTKARVSRVPGSYAWQAEVAAGPHVGCRGVIGPRDFETATTPAAAGGLSQERVGALPAPAPSRAGEGQWTLWQRTLLVVLGAVQTPREEWREILRTERRSDCDAAKAEQIARVDQGADDYSVRAQAELSKVVRGVAVRVTAIPQSDGWDMMYAARDTRGERLDLRFELRFACHPVDQPPAEARARRGAPR